MVRMTRANKREILEAIFKKMDPAGSWQIMSPSRLDPFNPEYLCVFQQPSTYKEVRALIPTPWFDDGELDKIEWAVRDAIERSK